jgi:xylulokinase
MSIVVGVDSSTQSCTVEFRDAVSGKFLGRGSTPHTATNPPVSEQNPLEWWDALVLIFNKTCADNSIDKSAIAAISVAAQCHGLVTLDGNNLPVRPAKLWNDTTSAPQSQKLITQYGADFWLKKVNSIIGPSFTITKIAWLKENEPVNFDKTEHFLLPHDYLTFKFSGKFVTDRAGGSCTGYFSPQKNCWDFELLKLIDSSKNWEKFIPEVLNGEQSVGTITGEAASLLGISTKTKIGPGTGDQFASCLGLGISEGDIAFSLGTSGVVLTVSDSIVEDSAGWFNGMADASGRYMPVAVSLNATKVTQWATNILNCDLEELGRLALNALPGDNKLVLSAFFDGERTPDLPYATGTLSGINTQQTRENFARAAYEGVLLGLLRIFHHLGSIGIKTDGRLIVTGGGARGKAYPQILSDLIGREVCTLDVEESTARGACILASSLVTGHSIKQVTTDWAPQISQKFTPTHKSYSKELLERYTEITELRQLDKLGAKIK